MDFINGVFDGIQSFWSGLGSARGFVVGAVVTFAGVLINVRALGKLEERRSTTLQSQADTAWERQQIEAQDAWDRERGARLEDLRRETYTAVVAACESRAFLDTIPADRHPEVISAWRGSRATVRFVTDDRALIEAADALVDAAAKRATEPSTFKRTRTDFVALSRAELGRASLDIKTAKPSTDVPATT